MSVSRLDLPWRCSRSWSSAVAAVRPHRRPRAPGRQRLRRHERWPSARAVDRVEAGLGAIPGGVLRSDEAGSGEARATVGDVAGDRRSRRPSTTWRDDLGRPRAPRRAAQDAWADVVDRTRIERRRSTTRRSPRPTAGDAGRVRVRRPATSEPAMRLFDRHASGRRAGLRATSSRREPSIVATHVARRSSAAYPSRGPGTSTRRTSGGREWTWPSSRRSSCSCTSWGRSSRSGRPSPTRSWGRWRARSRSTRTSARARSEAIGNKLVYPLAIFQGITGVLLIIALQINPQSQPWLVAGIILYLIAITYALTVQRNALHHLIELTSTPPPPGTPPGPPPPELLAHGQEDPARRDVPRRP